MIFPVVFFMRVIGKKPSVSTLWEIKFCFVSGTSLSGRMFLNGFW